MQVCVSCQPLGRCRYGLTSERLDGEALALFELVCPPDHEGGPGVAHAGWTAGALSEVISRLLYMQHGLSVVASLTVDYEKPVPIGRPLAARSWVEQRNGRKWNLAAEITLSGSGAVLARARGLSILRDRGTHYSDFEEWLGRETGEA
jgi:acyl-coenzyme A thioesterase PaaI-like protein